MGVGIFDIVVLPSHPYTHLFFEVGVLCCEGLHPVPRCLELVFPVLLEDHLYILPQLLKKDLVPWGSHLNSTLMSESIQFFS